MFSSSSWICWFSFFRCMQNASVEECFLHLRGDLDACTSAPLLPDGRIGRVTHNPNKAVEKEGRGIFRYMMPLAASIPTRAGGRLTRAIEAGKAAYLYVSGNIYKAGPARNCCGRAGTGRGHRWTADMGAERKMADARRQGGDLVKTISHLVRGGRAPCRAPRAANARPLGGQVVDGRRG